MRWLLLFLSALPAWACICGPPPTAKQAWRESPRVFVGRVEQTSPAPAQGLPPTARIRVEEAFKGVSRAQTLVIEVHGGSCSSPVAAGDRYLFYLFHDIAPDRWAARPCHRTTDLQDAADDLLFLRALPKSAEETRLSGTVVYQERGANRGAPYLPLAAVRVRLTGPRGSVEVTTNQAGVFEQYGLPPGEYLVEPTLPRGLKIAFSQVSGLAGHHRTLHPDAGLTVFFLLMSDTHVSGRVFGPTGQPLAGIPVEAKPQPGRSKLHLPGTRSNKDGTYAFEDLPPGRYQIVANRESHLSAKVPFGAIFAPGTPDATKAAILEVKAGQRKEIDIQIPGILPLVSLKGRVTQPDGRPSLFSDIVFESDGYRESAGIKPDGTFSLEILAGRPGRLTAELSAFEFGVHCGYRSEFYAAPPRSQSRTSTGTTSRSQLGLTLATPKCETPR